MPPLTPAQVQQFARAGYVIVRGAFSPERVVQLRSAVGDALERLATAEEAGEDVPTTG